jgi:hypothetical protein
MAGLPTARSVDTISFVILRVYWVGHHIQLLLSERWIVLCFGNRSAERIPNDAGRDYGLRPQSDRDRNDSGSPLVVRHSGNAARRPGHSSCARPWSPPENADGSVGLRCRHCSLIRPTGSEPVPLCSGSGSLHFARPTRCTLE